jgi:hypothetical protein
MHIEVTLKRAHLIIRCPKQIKTLPLHLKTVPNSFQNGAQYSTYTLDFRFEIWNQYRQSQCGQRPVAPAAGASISTGGPDSGSDSFLEVGGENRLSPARLKRRRPILESNRIAGNPVSAP